MTLPKPWRVTIRALAWGPFRGVHLAADDTEVWACEHEHRNPETAWQCADRQTSAYPDGTFEVEDALGEQMELA